MVSFRPCLHFVLLLLLLLLLSWWWLFAGHGRRYILLLCGERRRRRPRRRRRQKRRRYAWSLIHDPRLLNWVVIRAGHALAASAGPGQRSVADVHLSRGTVRIRAAAAWTVLPGELRSPTSLYYQHHCLCDNGLLFNGFSFYTVSGKKGPTVFWP